MPTRYLKVDNSEKDAFWHGNNAAFACPCCGRVFLVSAHMSPHGLHCPPPGCGRSYGYVEGGRDSDGIAVISWPVRPDEVPAISKGATSILKRDQ
jgi:hypothetical protein